MLANIARKRSLLWLWVLWLVVFYTCWLVLVSGKWPLVKAEWPIAAAMVAGGYAAGSTPMGGGTVAFPVLVLLFDLPTSLGRDFSFAVQSVGMVSASLFIFCRRQPLAWSLLRGAVLGSVLGTPLGVLLLAPRIPDLWVKLTFAVLWGSFGLLHLYRATELAAQDAPAGQTRPWDGRLGFGLGLAGGALAVGVTGVGIDMIVYCVLVLLYRCDLRVAIPTSVVIMAFCSLCGVAVKGLSGTWTPGVYERWLAAAPVVALGAPMGALVVDRIGRKPTLLVTSGLCVGQFFWTCANERRTLGTSGVVSAVVALSGGLLLLELLRLRSRDVADAPAAEEAPAGVLQVGEVAELAAPEGQA